MINWKCPKCGTINDAQSTSAYCINCGNSKWATMPTTAEPQTGTYFETPRSVCPDCTRLKALLQDAQELIHTPSGNPFEYKLKYDAFQIRIKQEGIE